jgi:hypothetical protein
VENIFGSLIFSIVFQSQISYRHNITEILLKVALNTINRPNPQIN